MASKDQVFTAQQVRDFLTQNRQMALESAMNHPAIAHVMIPIIVAMFEALDLTWDDYVESCVQIDKLLDDIFGNDQS